MSEEIEVGHLGRESKSDEKFSLGKGERKRDARKIPGASQPNTEEAEKENIQNERKGKSLR